MTPRLKEPEVMKTPAIFLGLMCLAISGCKKPADRFSGDEVFGVPATVAAGTTNKKLELALPPGLQELDLGMSRDEVADSRARHFTEVGPLVHGPNESTIEMHGYDPGAQTSSLPIDRVELGFSEETDGLSDVWASSEAGRARPQDFETLVEGLVEVFGEPAKLAKVREGRDFVLLWIAGVNGSGVKVLFSDSPDFRPTIDLYVQTKHGLTEENSGLNQWIAAAPAEGNITALEFTRKFIAKAFP